jgi:uncharacterized short protein YbdD (DUF466 family)
MNPDVEISPPPTGATTKEPSHHPMCNKDTTTNQALLVGKVEHFAAYDARQPITAPDKASLTERRFLTKDQNTRNGSEKPWGK